MKISWYVTCSLPMHTHPVYEEILQHIRANLQHIDSSSVHTLVEARGMYRSAQDWLTKWPALRDGTINGGLFFTLDEDGFIGKGVHTEITDILKKELPVYLVTHEGECFSITSLTGSAFVEGPDWKLYTFVDVKMLKP